MCAQTCMRIFLPETTLAKNVFSMEKYKENREALAKFFDMHFKTDDKYDSYIYVAHEYRYTTKNGERRSFPQYCFSINTHDPRNKHPYGAEKRRFTKKPTPKYLSKDWLDYAAKLSAKSDTDRYISINGYMRPKKKGGDNKLFQLHNIVVSLHREYCASNRDWTAVLDALVDFMTQRFDIVPNTIVYSRCDAQLWFAIKPCTAKLIKPWTNTAVHFTQEVENALKEMGMDYFVSVDSPASCKANKHFCLPMSYNFKTHSFSSVLFLHEQKLDLMQFYDQLTIVSGWKENKKTKKEKIASRNKGAAYSYFRNLPINRETLITDIIQDRQAHGESLVGCRNNMLYVVYNAYRTMTGSDEQAMDAVDRVNSLFDKPMCKRQVNLYLSSSRQKGGYKFTDEYVYNCIGITDKEKQLFVPKFEKVAAKNKKERREATKLRHQKSRQKANQRIISTIIENQYGPKKAAEACHVSESKVKRIAEEYCSGLLTQIKRTRIARREKQVVTLFARGMAPLDIGKELNIATQTVRKHLYPLFGTSDPAAAWMAREYVEEFYTEEKTKRIPAAFNNDGDIIIWATKETIRFFPSVKFTYAPEFHAYKIPASDLTEMVKVLGTLKALNMRINMLQPGSTKANAPTVKPPRQKKRKLTEKTAATKASYSSEQEETAQSNVA